MSPLLLPLLCALILSLSPSNVLSAPIIPGVNSFSLNISSIIRDYHVYVPLQYFNSSSPAAFPAVIALHGLGDDCQDFGRDLGFSSIADEFGMLFVYPCGLEGDLGVAWNAGTCCVSNYHGQTVDDVQFLTSMVMDLATHFPLLDSSRVFLTGFSNGAMMTARLACETPKFFRSFAVVSGVVVIKPGNNQGEAECSQSFASYGKGIPMLHIHGNADMVVPFTGNPLLGFPPVTVEIEDWVSRNGCTNKSIQTFKNGPYSNAVYSECPSGSVELVTVDGGKHLWNRDHYFDTTNYIWQFFQRSANHTTDPNQDPLLSRISRS